MMDTRRLADIIERTTVCLRKGDRVERSTQRGLDIVEVFEMPHEDEFRKEGFEKVDLCLLTVAVQKLKAEEFRDEVREIMASYPDLEQLASGPSYIHVGAVLGDQEIAFRLFALGKVLGLWDIITPVTFRFPPEAAKEAARLGYVMITGYKPEVSDVSV